jgi:hypothetical protein
MRARGRFSRGQPNRGHGGRGAFIGEAYSAYFEQAEQQEFD